MNSQRIQERWHRDTKPFVFRLSDGKRVGRRILVKHPDYIAIGGSVVLVTDADNNVQRLDSLHIVSLDDVRARKHNGKSRN